MDLPTPHRYTMLTTTCMIVLFTTLVFGSSTPFMLKLLNIPTGVEDDDDDIDNETEGNDTRYLRRLMVRSQKLSGNEHATHMKETAEAAKARRTTAPQAVPATSEQPEGTPNSSADPKPAEAKKENTIWKSEVAKKKKLEAKKRKLEAENKAATQIEASFRGHEKRVEISAANKELADAHRAAEEARAHGIGATASTQWDADWNEDLNITLSQNNTLAQTNQDDDYGGTTGAYGQAVRTAAPLPPTGIHCFEFVFTEPTTEDVGDDMGGNFFVGVCKSTIPKATYRAKWGVINRSKAWWGVEDGRRVYEGSRGLTKRVPGTACNSFKVLFGVRDRIGFAIDMDQGSMQFFRNGELVEEAAIKGLPTQDRLVPLYVVASPAWEGSTVQIQTPITDYFMAQKESTEGVVKTTSSKKVVI
jgi:hypothetical protein